MARIGLTQAAKLTGKAPSTITRRSNHNDPKKRLGFNLNDDGERTYDVAELERVFGGLQIPNEAPNNDSGATTRTGAIASISNDMQQELHKAHEAQNTLLQEKIALLQTQLDATRDDLEHWRDVAKSHTRMLEDRRKRIADRTKKNQEDQQNAVTELSSSTRPTQNSPQKLAELSNWFVAWLGRGT